MALRIPTNQIITSKYTVGKEYLVLSTYKEYQGYFYEMNNRYFAGKEFNLNAPELIKMNSDSINPLLLNPETSTYGKLSKIKLKNNKITSQPVGGNSKEGDLEEVNFYCKKINTHIIKKIDEETYVSLQNDPLYQIAFVGKYNSQTVELPAAEEQLPGISDWVVSDARGF
jgi:DNA-binding beta-propeller fold protein YncE